MENTNRKEDDQITEGFQFQDEDSEMVNQMLTSQQPELGKAESLSSYRLVNKEYYCYICKKKQKKMIAVKDLLKNGLTCDSCDQGFCEIIDADFDDFKGLVREELEELNIASQEYP